MGAVMVGSALMAVGGAFLTLSAFNAFFFNMINGRGWICIALVVFGSWRPGKALLGAILLVGADTVARTIVAPAEMPIGILTAAIGAPFFLAMLLRQRGLVSL